MARAHRSITLAFSRFSALALALLPLAVPSLAIARTARVPEDFPTIQAAADYVQQFHATDTVFVQPGYYPERVMTHGDIRLLGVPVQGSAEPMVRIDELRVQPPKSGVGIYVTGVHVVGPAVTLPCDGPEQVYYESCRFDAGMEGGSFYPDIWVISMRRCTVFGPLTLKAVETVVDSCTLHGPLAMLAVGAAVVTDNAFEDVPGFAANVYCEQRVEVTGNVVHGGGGGFYVHDVEEDIVRVDGNRIEGCTGTGIYVDTPDRQPSYIERNQVTRCAGTGIRASGLIQVTENRVPDCGGHGMDLVQLSRTGLVEKNVVGRCGGDGIHLQRYLWGDALGFQATGNTVYSCAGSGVVALSLVGGPISDNIAFQNHGYGLLAVDSDAVPVSCNDWFENEAGATSGAPASATDLNVDPLFCDVASDDVGLRSDSPLLDAPGCGLIGALGKGCDPPPVVIELELKQDVLPSGAHGGWVTAWLEPHAPFTASDVEIASVRLNGVPAASDGRIGDRDRDGIPDLQLRFDREAVGQTLGRGAVATLTVIGTMRGRKLIGTDTVRIPNGQAFRRPTDLDPDASAPVLGIGAPMVNGVAGRLRVAFTLADASPARIELLDVAGRVLVSQDVAGAGPGEHAIELAGRDRLAQGIYFLRIRQGAAEARTRAAIIR